MASTAAVAPPRNLKSQLSSAMAIVWAIALAKLLFHIYFNNRYGYFRDEFDYMSCGDHLQWGYVDQPPLIPFLTHLSRMLLGDSLRAIRFIPALASSLVVVQSAAIARLLIPPKAGMPHVSQGLRDVGSYSIILTAICVAFAPLYLSNGNLLGTNCLEPNLWMGCTWFAILAIKRNDPRYWLWFGVVAGIGMEEKYTIAVFGLAIVVSLLLTEQRRAFFNKWTWLGAAAAFLIFLPNLLWNLHYDWPFVQLIRSIRAEGRDVAFGPVEYFFQQMIIIGPLVTPLWVAGLLALLFWRPLKPYRLLGWSYIVSYIVIFLQHGKNYYLGPIYPMLFAAGAVLLQSAIDRTEQSQSRWQWAKSTIIYTFVINGICTAPIVVPMLSPEHFLAYAKVLPFKLPVNEYSHARAALPQWFSDQFGWKEIAEEAEVVWNRIPASERADCGIFAQDYGQAGAIDFFGRRHGLPGAISGDRTYWLWGPRGYTGSCLIVLDDRKERLEQLFTQVEYVGSSAHNEWALTTDVPFYIVHGPKFGTLQAVWPKIKRWR